MLGTYSKIVGGSRRRLALFVFVAAKKFVALDGGYYANCAFVARFGALHTAQAADANGSSQRDFVGQSEQNLYGGTFFYVFGEEEIDAAGADIARFRAGFADGCAGRPAHGEGQAHGEALRSSAFRASQGKPPLSK